MSIELSPSSTSGADPGGGGGGGGPGGQDSFFGGPPNFINREKTLRVHVHATHFSS